MATKVKERGTPPPAKKRVVIFGRAAYADGAYIARAFEPGQPEKFQLSIVMEDPKNPAIEEIEEIIEEAVTARWGKGANRPKVIRGLTFDPVIKLCADYPKMGIKAKDACFVRASSTDRPLIVGPNVKELNPADLRKECYSGREVAVSVTAFTYERNKGAIRGVSLGLGSIHLREHGERLGTPRPLPEDEFDPIDLPDADDDADDESGDEDFTPTPRPR